VAVEGKLRPGRENRFGDPERPQVPPAESRAAQGDRNDVLRHGTARVQESHLWNRTNLEAP